jgi:hypothetical protein
MDLLQHARASTLSDNELKALKSFHEKAGMIQETLIRFTVHPLRYPDYEWGAPFRGFDKFSACQARFREQCIERQGLDPDDTGRKCRFDLEAWTLILLRESIPGYRVHKTTHRGYPKREIQRAQNQ